MCALGFVVLAVLVDHGSLAQFDQWCVSNLMPWLPHGFKPGRGSSRFLLPATKHTLGGTLVELWTYPAAVAPSLVVVAVAAEALRRRGQRRAAAAWLGAYVVGNVVELLGKGALARPALFTHGRHVTPFDQSYPSGHALRALLLAAAVAWTWRRARVALAWAATVPFALVALGDHTVTDVVGGALAAAALAIVAASYASASTSERNARWWSRVTVGSSARGKLDSFASTSDARGTSQRN